MDGDEVGQMTSDESEAPERGRKSLRSRLAVPPRAGGKPSMKKRVSELFEEIPTTSKAESELEAANDLKQAMAPALDLLVDSVPGARTPEEAMSTIQREVATRPEPAATQPGGDGPPTGMVEAVVLYRVRRHMTRKAPTETERQWQWQKYLEPTPGPSEHGVAQDN